MKKKQLNYILVMVAAAVWALIAYRIFTGLGATEEPVPLTRQDQGFPKPPADDYALRPDTTRLRLNYRDPFSSKKPRDTSGTPGIKPAGVPLSPLVPQPLIDWSTIRYSGYMRNPGSKKLIALLTVNGKNLMLAEGEQAEKIKLLKNLQDSVKINYRGNTHYIRMN
jgi:hypothetical protein